ncbi:nuclear distribution protein nudE homolog 1-A [Trichonephila clavipes]|nr:nuclear distribution protein nudE homolog 1-A [Trichonephila clavipes]
MKLTEKLISENHRDEFSATSGKPSISPSPLRLTSMHFQMLFLHLKKKSNPTRQCSRDCAPVIEIPEISQTCVHEDFDEAVMKWIHTMQDKNVLISEPFVIEKAFPFVKNVLQFLIFNIKKICSSMLEQSISFSSIEEERDYYKALAAEYEAKYQETKLELEEFQDSSRELEAELETQLEQTEVRNRELKSLSSRLQLECDSLKDKLQKTQHDSQSQIADLEDELSRVRATRDDLQKYIRELEQLNDDLERAKRAAVSSLEDFESRLNQRSAFDQVSKFDRGRIVAYRDCGLSFREIGCRVGRNQTTVMRICDPWMQEGTTDRRGRSHPPQCSTSRGDRQIVHMAVTDRSHSGLSARRPLFGLLLTQNHRRLCHQWWDERRMWAAEWNEVVFTDESRICLQHHDGQIRVWRHRGERMLNSCIMHRHTGPAPGIMGLATAIFQQDNVRPHVARIVQRFFVNHQIELLPFPARSPDLSAIENMWSMVAQRLTQITPPAATPDQL